MNKRNLMLLLLVSAILLVGAWSQSELDSGTTENNPTEFTLVQPGSMADYPLDGKLFQEEFAAIPGAFVNSSGWDNHKDGAVYDQFYGTPGIAQKAVPDFPLDGAIFQSHYEELARP